MFKKRLVYQVDEMEAIDFCRILGKYGFQYNISKLRKVARNDGTNWNRYYREFVVYATNRQARMLNDELNGGTF